MSDKCAPLPTMRSPRDKPGPKRWGNQRVGAVLAIASVAALVLFCGQRSPFGLVVAPLGGTGSPVSPGPRPSGWSWSDIEPSRTLEWHACFEDGQHDCARLDAADLVKVPMDWQDPRSERRVVLAIARIRATDQTDYRGPVIFNPGECGHCGTTASCFNRLLVRIIYDPRGGQSNPCSNFFSIPGDLTLSVGASTPRHQCWETPEQEKSWNLRDPGVFDSHAGIISDLYVRATAYSQACERAMNDSELLRHSGSVSAARDLLEIVNQGSHDNLRYWGFSYGTIIGGVFAAMYPDRVERLVSDGNVDYEEWFNTKHLNFVHDTEKVVEAFYDSCHQAGPAKCAFYEDTPQGIKERLDRLFAAVKRHPVIISPSDEGPAVPELVTWSELKRLLFSALYQPQAQFADFARIAAALEKGDARPFYKHYQPEKPSSAPICAGAPVSPFEPLPDVTEGTSDTFPAVRCADRNLHGHNATMDQILEEANAMLEISPATGAVNALHSMVCLGRTVKPKWRFQGPFTGETKHPILYIANMADNTTPLISARNNSAGFPGSVVLVQNSYGHTSLAAPSNCTQSYINTYFQEGTLPSPGTECDEPFLPFEMANSPSPWVHQPPL
ncbi:hypothetical protein D7B24_008771 [Verticillium nonalfalfae]|uniref:Peptidase S33 tripeptidyl aminopeptidase-like C-terminal domain-containing protein n=1 Tax=Verticillium nonalfalfae TaxID=1051616 RepID=A0A3M9Y8B3_9PEZI|nr:uncharacterized protein D7B24_008771 [Verticillium nonalfalfae]RNJ55340.1 hypothetical protein D7B24_008771 [Verticillium nonalfalfae]